MSLDVVLLLLTVLEIFLFAAVVISVFLWFVLIVAEYFVTWKTTVDTRKRKERKKNGSHQ